MSKNSSRLDQSIYGSMDKRTQHKRSNTSKDLAYYQEQFLKARPRILVGPQSLVGEVGKEITPSNIGPSMNNTKAFERQQIHCLALKVKQETKEALYFSHHH